MSLDYNSLVNTSAVFYVSIDVQKLAETVLILRKKLTRTDISTVSQVENSNRPQICPSTPPSTTGTSQSTKLKKSFSTATFYPCPVRFALDPIISCPSSSFSLTNPIRNELSGIATTTRALLGDPLHRLSSTFNAYNRLSITSLNLVSASHRLSPRFPHPIASLDSASAFHPTRT